MNRVRTLTVEFSQPFPLPWAVLFAEISAAALLLFSGRVPAVAVRALQIFLRF